MQFSDWDPLVDALKRRADFLQRDLRRGEPSALRRMRVLAELRALPASDVVERVQRRHCLAVLARELGLSGWSHLTALRDDPCSASFGTLLYPARCGGHWNVWCATYDEAARIHTDHGGFLLCYRRQLFLADRHFVTDLGVDPDDADWTRIGRDWAEPRDPRARHRLLRAVIEAGVRTANASAAPP